MYCATQNKERAHKQTKLLDDEEEIGEGSFSRRDLQLGSLVDIYCIKVALTRSVTYCIQVRQRIGHHRSSLPTTYNYGCT